jgi:hypothetical protein
MDREHRTAGLLPRPVWLIVRPDEGGQRRALGPILTLEKLKGVAEGVGWASPGDEIEGYAEGVPEDCLEIGVDSWSFQDLETLTFEQQLVDVLWYDDDEETYNPEKEWNADRWQDVGLLLESFGIDCPEEDSGLAEPGDTP